MDSRWAADVIERASEVVVKVGGRPKALLFLSDDEKAELKDSRRRDPHTQLGKRYLRAEAELQGLEEAFKSLEGLVVVPRGHSARQAGKGVGRGDGQSSGAVAAEPCLSLALVPQPRAEPVRIATVHPPRPQRQKPVAAAALEHIMSSDAVRALGLAAKMASYVPMLFVWAGCIYSLCLIGYLLAKPETVVIWAFKTLDAIPAYGGFVAGRIANQTVAELSARFR
jgi:hypothetical protein